MQQTIPLNKLVLSPRNVRKTNGEEDIAGLADSIAAEGLLQNLVVSQADDGKTFEVDAGGRRLRALQLLVERKELPKNWPVPVRVIQVVEARHASLAENLQKVTMNPADEVEGYAALIADWSQGGMDEHTAVVNCARRFGQTERYVRQRLALAALAPEILDALRDGRIGLAAASAYASHPDQQQQLKVFKEHEKRLGTYGRHDPRGIRDTLQGRLYTFDHKLVRYVGLEAYREAGGVIAPDLFFDEEEREVATDTALIEKLATEKGAIEAQRLAQADGWLDGLCQPVTGFSYQRPKTPAGYREAYAPIESSRPPERRADAIAIYRISDEGTLVPHPQYIFEKLPELADPDEGSAGGHYKPETVEERQARYRMNLIRNRAFRLAIPQAAGTPFEGRLFFEPLEYRDEEFEEDPSDPNMVLGHVLVRVPRADLEAQLAEAERRYELEQQELREEEEALAAEAAEHAGPEDDADDEAEQGPGVNDHLAPQPEVA